MKSRVIIPLLIGTSLMAEAETVVPAPTGAETVPQAQPGTGEQQVTEALAEAVSVLETAVPLLSGIRDKPTAELHAFDVGNLFNRWELVEAALTSATEGLKESDLVRTAPREARRYRLLSKRFAAHCRRLARADYYDSIDLCAAMGDEVVKESEPEKERELLPEEEVARLAAEVAPAQARYLQTHRNVQGGPGFTRETAWLMLDEKMSVIAQEYDIMSSVLHRRSLRQSLVEQEGRWYDLLEYDIEIAGVTYTVDQWFDITLHADKMSERAAADGVAVPEPPAAAEPKPVQKKKSAETPPADEAEAPPAPDDRTGRKNGNREE